MSQIKKIAIDTLPLSSGHATRGTGMYTRNIIKALQKQTAKQKDIIIDGFVFKDNKKKLGQYDLIHYPYFDLFYNTLPLVNKTKTIVTVHDVTPLLFPKYYPPGIIGKINFRLQKLALKKADAIITISETSKKDIVRLLDIPEHRITRIYEAPNFLFRKQTHKLLLNVKEKFNLPDQFILYIGDVNWNKNLLNLVRAVKKISAKLVIVGKQAVNTDFDRSHIENAPLRELQDKYGHDKDIRRLGFVEDSDLNAIWQLAEIYCLPSLYEGFGLSIVEAMAASVPIACAKTQALVEVADDAALYFDPNDISDISAKLEKLIRDKNLQKNLITKGHSRVKYFSWEKAAKETISVYQEVLEK